MHFPRPVVPVFIWWFALPLQGQDGGVITRLPTTEKVIALTFDACESRTPSYFDTTILTYLLEGRIPFTIFVGGRFAVRNRESLARLAALDFVEVENHSFHHVLHMEALDDSSMVREVRSAEDTLASITGRRPRMFRFPGGHYDAGALATVRALGYRVVHWSFESGDPDSSITPEMLRDRILQKTKAGTILIFHINRRGYSTGKALPSIVEELKSRGYRFVLLQSCL